jgi:magnesium-transporting ATPase (P-type)
MPGIFRNEGMQASDFDMHKELQNAYEFHIGVNGLVKNLRTNLDSPNDLEDRVRHFGTNRKEPPERTPYWEFFIKAIDDFMLKLLLVCACVDIGFGVGFAAPEDRSHGKFLSRFCHLMRSH